MTNATDELHGRRLAQNLGLGLAATAVAVVGALLLRRLPWFRPWMWYPTLLSLLAVAEIPLLRRLHSLSGVSTPKLVARVAAAVIGAYVLGGLVLG